MELRHATYSWSSRSSACDDPYGIVLDTKKALARTSNKVKTSLFRLFHWSPDFEIGKESSLVAVWMKFYNLLMYYFNESVLHILGSLLRTVLPIHNSTLDLTPQMYAKVCIEIDMSKKFVDMLWIGTSKNYA